MANTVPSSRGTGQTQASPAGDDERHQSLARPEGACHGCDVATIAAESPSPLRQAMSSDPARGAPADGRLADLAARAVLAISVLLAMVEVGRIALFNSDRLAVAVVATCAWLPLHVWHLRFGLRSAHPPHGGWTLAAMAAIQLGALVAIGPSWSMMLASLATSAMIVLPFGWGLVALAGCVLAPAGADLLDHDLGAAFRSGIQFTLVWLVAAARELAATRRLAAADAAASEARRIESEMHLSLERSLDELMFKADGVRQVFGRGDRAAAARALDALRSSAAASIADVRQVVGGARRALAAARTADAVALAHPPTAVGGGLTGAGARLSFAVVNGVCLVFVLTASLGAFGGDHGPAAVVMPCWTVLATLQLSTAIAVARGAVPSWPLVRLSVALVVTGIALALCGSGWREPGYIFGAIAAATLPGRVRVATLAVLVLTAATRDMVTLHAEMPGVDVLIWDFAYVTVVVSLAICGLYGAARLIHLLDEIAAGRDAHIAAAVDRQRRRIWADLHDVLGQTLTTISLKADLARRVVERDPARAAGELDELIELSRGQAEEIRAIARGDRPVTFDAEVAGAVRLLREAGVDVRYEVDVQHVDRARDALLGSVVREGTTNILRHAAEARRCEMRAARRGEWVVFELRNDGADAPPDGGGTGLAGLADRATACGGSVETARARPDWFVLRAWVPAQESAP
jgi:two-component system sensor histidine kinase DesK